MSDYKKRPKLVWTIFIFMLVGGVYGLYSVYNISTGSTQLPEGFIKPSGFFYFAKAIINSSLWLITAFLLFFRKEVTKWFFLGLLVYSIINDIYTSIFTILPDEYHTIAIISKIIGLIILALITRYVFKLNEKNYYIVNKAYNKNEETNSLP